MRTDSLTPRYNDTGSGVSRPIRPSLMALCVLVAIWAALAGCGSTGTTPPQPTQGGGNGPQPTLQDNPSNQHGNADGLMAVGSFSCTDHLVLASDQLTYNDSDIQRMLSYMSAQTSIHYAPDSMPPFMRSVVGSPMDAGSGGVDLCTADVAVTNESSQTVTIVGGGVHNVSAPVTNTFEYRTIDFCQLQQQGAIPGSVPLLGCGRGGGPTCSYDLQVPLSSGDVGTDYTKPFAVDGCKTISLPPSQEADITMQFQPDQPLIYLVNPELTVADGSGTHNVIFSDWSSTLAFASVSQMPCYQLAQDTFSLESGATYCS